MYAESNLTLLSDGFDDVLAGFSSALTTMGIADSGAVSASLLSRDGSVSYHPDGNYSHSAEFFNIRRAFPDRSNLVLCIDLSESELSPSAFNDLVTLSEMLSLSPSSLYKRFTGFTQGVLCRLNAGRASKSKYLTEYFALTDQLLLYVSCDSEDGLIPKMFGVLEFLYKYQSTVLNNEVVLEKYFELSENCVRRHEAFVFGSKTYGETDNK